MRYKKLYPELKKFIDDNNIQGWNEFYRAINEFANLRGANLRGANLRGAYLGGANLYGANLGDANLDDTSLHNTNLGGANLRGANLRGAYLGGANLYGADLGGAYLGDAYLRGANLGGANLRGAYLGDAKGIKVVGPTGNTGRFIYANWYKDTVYIQAGCRYEPAKDVLKAIADKYGKKSDYYKLVKTLSELEYWKGMKND